MGAIELVDAGRNVQLMKKFLVGLLVLVFSVSGLAFAVPATVNAATCTMGQDTDSNFFSFPTWYRGLKGVTKDVTNPDQTKTTICTMEGSSPGSMVFTIALNIIDIALRVVALAAVGFVIYGGFRYVISRGEPEETKKAMDTILKALIGAVIAMIAAVAVSFIVGGLNK